MKEITHIVIGATCGVVATGFDSSPDAVGWAALLIGSTLPDLDHKRSFIGKYLPWIAAPIERRFGHRTFTHSLLGTALFALLLSPSLMFSDSLLPWAVIGYLSHILLDSFNIQGVPLLYPFSNIEFVSWHNKGWRVPYGSKAEMTVLACVSLGTLALFPLAEGGFSPAFHRMIGSPGAAIEDFHRWRSTNKVYVTIHGDSPLKREALKGKKMHVLDALSPVMLLVEDEAGVAYRLGAGPKAAECELWAFKVMSEKGEPITQRQWTVDLSGRSIGDLLDLLPKQGRVYCNADLQLSHAINTPPVTGQFLRAQASGSTLQLRSARRGDLRSIRNAVIENGVTFIRAEFAEGEVGELAELDNIRKHTRSVNLSKLPSLDSVLVNVGDDVRSGQPLVRQSDDAAHKAATHSLEDSRARLALLVSELAQLEAGSAGDLKAARFAITENQAALEKVAWLVDRGAKPRNASKDAQAALTASKELD